MKKTRFHHAVAAAIDDHQFAHIPVDWHDATVDAWRPTVLVRGLGAAGFREEAEILVPVSEGFERELVAVTTRRVAIIDLRPSELITEGSARFFSTRYTLEMLDALMPTIDAAGPEERRQLRNIADELVRANHQSYKDWADLYWYPGNRSDLASWQQFALDTSELPRYAAARAEKGTGLFNAIDRHRLAGEITCSPVAVWDETSRRWRATILLDATGDERQFRAGHDAIILIPGDPVDTAVVPGSLLQPIDISDACFSLLAIPLLGRDFLRMQDALLAAGMPETQVAAHPCIIAFARMLRGAAGEWQGIYEEGMAGPEPQPRVTPLPPSMWGFTSGDPEPVWR